MQDNSWLSAGCLRIQLNCVTIFLGLESASTGKGLSSARPQDCSPFQMPVVTLGRYLCFQLIYHQPDVPATPPHPTQAVNDRSRLFPGPYDPFLGFNSFTTTAHRTHENLFYSLDYQLEKNVQGYESTGR